MRTCDPSLDARDLILPKRTSVEISINELDKLDNMLVLNMSVIVSEHSEWRPPEDEPEPAAPQEVPPAEPETPPTPPAEEPPGPDEVPQQPPESVAA